VEDCQNHSSTQKDSINDVKNYKPITSMFSTSKVLKKLILKRILKVQDENGVDLTGSSQHGFKLGRSTSTFSVDF
jgi:hypothetical protein